MILLLVRWCAILSIALIASGNARESSFHTLVKGHAVAVECYSPSIVRVRIAPSASFSTRPSLSVIATPQGEGVSADNDRALTISTTRLRISVSKRDGSILFRNGAGRTILSVGGITPASFAPTPAGDEQAFAVRQDFTLIPGEAVYGLGQFEDRTFNYRGHDIRLVQANRTAINPLLISTRGYGILWDNTSASRFCDTQEGTFFWSEVADQIDFYVVYGPSLDSVVAGYRTLTGQAPMFGKWAYGFWQSKERYKTSSELIDVVKEYRRRMLPIDNIIQDWAYWGGIDRFSGMVWDSAAYPDPSRMVDSLHALHAHLTVSIWPAFGTNTDILRDMRSRGFLYPLVHWNGGFVYDAYNPDARALYWKYVKKGLFDIGVDGYWMDATEPEFSCSDDRYATELSLKECRTNYLGTFSRYLNPYSLMTTAAVYENHRKATDRKRAFILTRSAFSGQQRYGAATWSGDTFASWDDLRVQIASALNFSMAGIPYWTNDIGGFITDFHFPRGLDDPAYRELFVRWFQFGAFCPLFRVHGTNIPREVWRFGAPGDENYDALAKALRLRYRLLPYIYSIAWNVTSRGASFLRGLPMEFPEDRNTHAMAGQFLFGPSLMVRPVTRPIYHPPDYPGVDITPEHFYAADGREHALTLSVFKGTDLASRVMVRKMDVSQIGWTGCLPAEVKDTSYSLRLEGMLRTETAGTYRFFVITSGGVRCWVNNRLIIDAWGITARTVVPAELELPADTRVQFRVEHRQPVPNTAVLKINWTIPGEFAGTGKTVDVYFPRGRSWFDFWTGKSYAGGTTSSVEAPLDLIPLYVPAGSILPVGPPVQYAMERPSDTLEVRVYPGKNASFELYDDEGDGYAYEHGANSTIPFRWNNRTRELAIGPRQGSYIGMRATRVFRVVLVSQGHGSGDSEESHPDRVIVYSRGMLRITLR